MGDDFMYEEVDFKFDKVSFMIKLGIIIFLILCVAIVIMIFVSKNNNNDIFNTNFKTMKEVSLNYFKDDKLPKNVDEKVKLTLSDMIKNNLIEQLKDKKGKSCNEQNSYAEITSLEDHYELVINLECDNNTKNEKIDIKKEIYYEYVKVEKEYSAWQLEKIEGENVESKEELVSISSFCKNKTSNYYFTSYIDLNLKKSYTYKVKLSGLPNGEIYANISDKGYFDDTLHYYSSYLVQKNLSIISGLPNYNVTVPNIYVYRDSSLKSSNFSFSVDSIKKESNYYYAYINISVKNANNVKPYYDRTSKKSVYFIPFYFTIQYTDPNECVRDLTDNASSYSSYKTINTSDENVTLYRNFELKNNYDDIKWSKEKSLEGYTQTGKTELR